MALADLMVASAQQGMAMLANADMAWGAYSARVIFSEPGMDLYEGAAVEDAPSVVYYAADFPGLSQGAAITVDSISYNARAPRKLDDGTLVRVALHPS